MYAWGIGVGPIYLDNDKGFPFNSDGEYKAFRMNIAGLVDASGTRFYWTSQPRPIEVGLFTYGDPAVYLRGNLLGAGLTKHEIECPASCFEHALSESGVDSVTVMRHYLHMHHLGVKIDGDF